MNRSSQNIRKYAQLLGSICGGLLISLPAIPQAAAQQTTPKVNPCPRIFYEEPHNSRVLVPQGCPPNALTRTMAAQGLIPGMPSPDQTRLGTGGEAPSVLNPNPGILTEPPYNRSQGTLQPDGSMVPTAPEPGVRQPGTAPGEQTLVPSPGETTIPTRPPASTIQPPAPEQRQAPVATIALANGRVNIRLVNNTRTNVTYQVIGDTPERSLPGNSDVTLRGLSTPTTVTFRREDGGLLTVTPKASSQTGMLFVTFKETTDADQDIRAMRIQNNGSVFLN